MAKTDQEIFLWLNGLVGNSFILDGIIQRIVSDYLVPVVFSTIMYGLWLGWRNESIRDRHQYGVMVAVVAIGLVSILVKLSNLLYFRPRPFETLDVNLLFYQATDSSFPCNPVAVTAAMAFGVFLAEKRVGIFMYFCCFCYGLARIYSGVAYPTDVIGGYMMGVGSGLIAMIVLDRVIFTRRLLLRLARLFYAA